MQLICHCGKLSGIRPHQRSAKRQEALARLKVVRGNLSELGIGNWGACDDKRVTLEA